MDNRTAAFALSIIVLSVGGCASVNAPAPRTALISHIVFFDLQDPIDADDLIRDCDDLIANIPTVSTYTAGRHIDTGRPTIDANYDVGLYVGFNSLEDYAQYVEHPVHKSLVEKWTPRLMSFTVRDVLDDTP